MNTETAKKMGEMRLYGMQTAFKTYVDILFTNLLQLL